MVPVGWIGRDLMRRGVTVGVTAIVILARRDMCVSSRVAGTLGPFAIRRRGVLALALRLAFVPGRHAARFSVDEVALAHTRVDPFGRAVVHVQRQVHRLEVGRADVSALLVGAGGLEEAGPYREHFGHARACLLGDEAKLRVVDATVVPAEPVDAGGHQAVASAR
jgi:hypothetical protein